MQYIKLWDVGPVKSVGYGHNIIEESICGPWDALNQYTLVKYKVYGMWDQPNQLDMVREVYIKIELP